MRCFSKIRRGTGRTDFANIFIPLETRGTSPLPSETDESKRILAPPECICCRAMALLDARRIGKAAQSVKQKRLQSMNRCRQRIFGWWAHESNACFRLGIQGERLLRRQRSGELSCHHERPSGREGSAVSSAVVPALTKADSSLRS